MIKLLLASDNVISSYRCKSMIGYTFHAIMKMLPNFRGNLVAAVAVKTKECHMFGHPQFNI
jgi:hypothetical protein